MKDNRCKCAFCTNCERTEDHRGWVHYSCPYAPNIEFLKDFPTEPLNETCGKFKATEWYRRIKSADEQKKQMKKAAELLEKRKGE